MISLITLRISATVASEANKSLFFVVFFNSVVKKGTVKCQLAIKVIFLGVRGVWRFLLLVEFESIACDASHL